MKKSYLLLLGCVVGVSPLMLHSAQAVPAASAPQGISPIVQAVLAAHPSGGKGLALAIKQLLIAHPALAADVVSAANAAKNPAVAKALAVGFADALVALQNSGNAGASSLAAAKQSFSTSLQAVVSVAQAQALSFVSAPTVSVNTPAILSSGAGLASPN